MNQINFSKNNGLAPVIIQEELTGEILMLGFMNEEAWQKTQTTGLVYFWSRSRNKLWKKGETSGNMLRVKNISTDCDNDALLVQVELIDKSVCHKGTKSCFSQVRKDDPCKVATMTFEVLYAIIEDRKKRLPKNSYVASLFKEGEDRIIQKIGEEAVELVIAAKNKNRKQIIAETVDLWFHSLIILSAQNIKLKEIWQELDNRSGK